MSVICYGFLDNELFKLLGVDLLFVCKKLNDVGD